MRAIWHFDAILCPEGRINEFNLGKEASIKSISFSKVLILFSDILGKVSFPSSTQAIQDPNLNN